MIQSTNVLTVVALTVPLVIGPAYTVATPPVHSKVRHFQQGDLSGQGQAISLSASVGQAYFWEPKWQAQEALASQDLREGRYEEFDNAEDAIAWLFGDQA